MPSSHAWTVGEGAEASGARREPAVSGCLREPDDLDGVASIIAPRLNTHDQTSADPSTVTTACELLDINGTIDDAVGARDTRRDGAQDGGRRQVDLPGITGP
jgi:hypothetical protein